jgi:hypothetical protein
MLDFKRTIWIDLAHAVESVAPAGQRVWDDPASVRKTLGDIVAVLPLTHAQIDAGVVAGSAQVNNGWRGMLEGTADGFLREMACAISDAFRPPKVWGVGLPCPKKVAAALGDISERAILKTGLQLAARLRLFRDAGAAFVAMDFCDTAFAEQERALAPIFRNAQMYGWTRALCVRDLEAGLAMSAHADAVLLIDSEENQLRDVWQRGVAIGGGLTERIWNGQMLAVPPPPRFLLFGRVPAQTAARAIVEAARTIASWRE